MKKITVLFAMIIAVICANAQTAGLITAKSFDKITKNTTLADLKKIYGAKNIVEDIEYAPEALDSFRVTKIFRDTKKEIIVYWAKNKRHKQVESVEAYDKNSIYKTAEGIHAGSTLDELVKVNGKRINFGGFGWDYGGGIGSFNKGKLENSKIFFTLSSDDNLPDKLLGEVQLNSDMALVKKNMKKIYVARVSVSF